MGAAMIELSEKQKDALKEIEKWFKGKEQTFALAGYAGTGKTTIAKYIAQNINNVAFCAYTGKAANVLREKGCQPAGTIHGFLYSISERQKKEIETLQERLIEAMEKGNKKLVNELTLILEEKKKVRFTLNTESDLKYSNLVIVDEYSMLDNKIISDLQRVCKKILYLGDPFQLPPIAGECSIKPNLLLTEIHRQALESPIIRASIDVREGRKLKYCLGEEFTFASKKEIAPEIFLNAEQVLVGRNNTRTTWNKRFRQIKGFNEPLPQAGEKVICLKNNHEASLYNGMIEKVVAESIKHSGYFDLFLKGMEAQVWNGDILGSNKVYDYNSPYDRALERFDFAYCITVHKSQGSEWNDIVVYNEPIGRPEERAKWLYTAITRAKKKLTVVQPV